MPPATRACRCTSPSGPATGCTPRFSSSERHVLSYVSEIRLFAGDKPPKDWLPCNGAVLRIADNEILFSRIGWDFGPFAQTAFSLPTLAAPAAGVQFVICAKGMYPFD